MEKMLKNNKGFSLVELLIALLIMAVIAAIAIGLFGGILNTTKGSADREAAETIRKSIMTYMNASNDTTLYMLGVSGTTPCNTIVDELSSLALIDSTGGQQRSISYSTVPTGGITTIVGPFTNTSSAAIGVGTYGPFMDTTKGLIRPLQPGWTGWAITVHSSSLRVEVSPRQTDGTLLILGD